MLGCVQAQVAQAAVSEPLAARLRVGYAALQDLLGGLIAEAGESGPVGDGAAMLDPQREARALLALSDGLTGHVLVGHLTAEAAEEALHVYVVGLRERLRTSRSGQDV
ncbi:TetR family transcriptional regulator C-terminal domain-containing protein [Streptomyces marianii]|uniref:BetI-type transcriptional repressor C-terminal domain-containing protein n=1 Tax=Streptomyces marianii TaxID=1817406 RepID=A0A5R9EG77_9ACTN|nr:TetR family transcriptional regulator C-terminal domain-containing protein [Streptomyces marianii]TLQ48165.1 hypothetical protein FEF34_12225 [Streptomyces marianii]